MDIWLVVVRWLDGGQLGSYVRNLDVSGRLQGNRRLGRISTATTSAVKTRWRNCTQTANFNRNKGKLNLKRKEIVIPREILVGWNFSSSFKISPYRLFSRHRELTNTKNSGFSVWGLLKFRVWP